jgi:hypothetical protein
MKSTIPSEVLALKARLGQWRATRHHIRERMPAPTWCRAGKGFTTHFGGLHSN